MANPPGPQTPVFIEEDIAGGLRAELRDADGPFGRPRDTVGFNLGGTLEHTAIYLPGRDTPIFQIKQARERDFVLRGAFRDHLRAQDLGAADPTHAADQVELLERIRRRGNPVTVTRGADQIFGILAETDFGFEGDHDITYELTFKVSSRGGVAPDPQPATQTRTASGADLAQAIADDLAEHRARFAALAADAQSRAAQAAVLNALDLAAAAVSDVVVAAAALESTPTAPSFGDVARLDGLARAAQTAVGGFAAAVALSAPALAAGGTPVNVVATWQAVYPAAYAVTGWQDDLRTIRADNRARVRRAARLYTVRDGDTLESIAREQLGDASRAGELGVRADELRPGLVIRIPQEA